MWSKLLMAYTTVTFIPLLIEFFLKNYYRKENQCFENNSNYTCVFTTVNSANCRQHIYDNAPCGTRCSLEILKSIVSFVANAKESVSLCMYLLTCTEICSALIDCHKKGKIVRVILDEKMWGCSSSKGRILRRCDIPVKIQPKNGGMMHHKFCLIDENTPSAKLFIGTLNMTLQGLCSNWDSFVYSDDKEIISSLKTEFEEMWSAFCNYDQLL